MKKESESTNSLNIVFLSSDSSGKSSLLYRLFNNSFKEKINEKKRFYRFIINYYNKLLTINFFDTKSMKGKREMNEPYYVSSDIIIFIYDLEKEKPEISIEPLLEIVKKDTKENFEKIQLGIIGNKLDLIDNNNIKKLKKEGEIFADKINSKFMITSAKSGKEDIFLFILELIDGRYKGIYMKNKRNIINEYTNFYKLNNDYLDNLIRCYKCKSFIAKITFYEYLSYIEVNCQQNDKEKYLFTYKQISELCKNKIKCEFCKKIFKEKSDESLINYKVYNKLICEKCLKKHFSISENDIISPYYQYDVLCKKHLKLNNLICLDCQFLMCSLCCDNHYNHSINQIDNNFINQIINEKRKLIKMQLEQNELLNKSFLDLIENLKSLFNTYLENKNLELKLKEAILNHFELIKFNTELYKSVINMEFPDLKKTIDIRKNISITEKLSNFFNNINQPIKITKFNICQDYKEFQFNLNYNNINKGDLNQNNCVTDACNYNNDYYCISFDDGCLRIYSILNSYKKTYHLYENKKGINSILNYNGSNIIYASGWEKVYELIINDDLSLEKKAIINNKNIIYQKICSYKCNNSILFSDNLGNINLYDCINKIESTVNISNEKSFGIANIIEFSNLFENIFYIKYKILDLNIDLEGDTIIDCNDNTKMDKENQKEYSSIFYLNDKNIVFKDYSIPSNYKIIGTINSEYLFIQINQEKNNPKYKIYNYINHNEINFINPFLNLSNTWKFKIIKKSKINNIIYFLLIDSNINILEFSFNQLNKTILQIGYIRKENNNLTIKNNIVKLILLDNYLIIINNNKSVHLLNY